MKGNYLLFISVDKDCLLKIGALGRIHFPQGLYVYVGSAQNGIEGRVKRHFNKNKKKFWHIDYLLSSKNTKIKKVLIRENKKDKNSECRLARSLAKVGEPIRKFGSSDCHCPSHLFKLTEPINENALNTFIKDFSLYPYLCI